jgi:2-iminobutanoate/2-iminopropanoate deaminase
MSLRETIIAPSGFYREPVPIGAKIRNLVFSSDIYGWDSENKQLPSSADDQAELLFKNIRQFMEQVGGTMENITYIMVCTRRDKHREALPAFNKPWLRTFPDENNRPARHAFQEEDLPMPAMLLRVNLIAVLGSERRETIHLENLSHTNPIPMGSKMGKLFFSSTIFGVPEGTTSESKVYPAEPSEQARILFQNIKRFLGSVNARPEDIGRVKLFLKKGHAPEGLLAAIDREWVTMFPDENDRPARPSTQEDFVPPGMLFRVEIIGESI